MASKGEPGRAVRGKPADAGMWHLGPIGASRMARTDSAAQQRHCQRAIAADEGGATPRTGQMAADGLPRLIQTAYSPAGKHGGKIEDSSSKTELSITGRRDEGFPCHSPLAP